MKRDARTLAYNSYNLALASSGIITLVLIISVIPGQAGRTLAPLQHMMWLTLISSGVGLLFAVTARQMLKGGSDHDLWRRASFGLWLHVVVLGLMLLMLIFNIVALSGRTAG